jgi:chaperonin GroEL
MFRKMYEEIGLDSNVTLQRSEYSPETYYEVLKGIEFRSGYLHSAFITDKDTSTVVFDNPYIHIDEEPITSLNDHYVQLLETSLNNRIPLVIIAPKFSDSFIRNVVMNRTRNSELEVVLITSPGYGEGVKKNYKDIRAFLDEGGHVEKIIVNTHEFFLFNEDTPYLQEHLNVLNTLAETSIEPYDQQDYYERYHRLQGSTAIIYAGGITEIAREEEFDRVEDALGSVRASLRGGFVLGGGLCLYNIESPLESLKRPLKQILINANENVEEILPEIGGEIGYDVKNRKLKNFKNIIDPAPVVVQSLINAYATAKLLTNTSYALYNEI